MPVKIIFPIFKKNMHVRVSETSDRVSDFGHYNGKIFKNSGNHFLFKRIFLHGNMFKIIDHFFPDYQREPPNPYITPSIFNRRSNTDSEKNFCMFRSGSNTFIGEASKALTQMPLPY